MPKKIESHRDLSIRWREDQNCFQLDLRTIGGKRENFATKAEATHHARKHFEIYRDGKPAVEIAKWNVEQAIDKYLAKAAGRVNDEDDRYGPASLANQKRDLTFILGLPFDGLSLAKRCVADLAVEFIEDDFWPELKRHNTSITALNRFSTFRQMMQHCLKKKQVSVNVCTLAEISKPSRKEKWDRSLKKSVANVNPESLQLILDNVAPQHKLKVLFAVETGLRVGEQVACRIYNPKKPELGGIDFRDNVIHVEETLKKGGTHADNYIGDPKSERGRRRVPIEPEFSLMLKEYWMALPVKMKAEGWLFPTIHGTRGCGTNWRERILYPACEKAGLPRDEWPRWHDLRHAYCTNYLNNKGNDWTRAMELMGHAQVSTTMIYKHVVANPEREQEDARASSSGLTINSSRPESEDGKVVKLVANS